LSSKKWTRTSSTRRNGAGDGSGTRISLTMRRHRRRSGARCRRSAGPLPRLQKGMGKAFEDGKLAGRDEREREYAWSSTPVPGVYRLLGG
jgi:hypothetical protein